MTTPQAVNMLWIGPELGLVERLSAVSFLAAGHQVQLHVYDEVKNVPDGVTQSDANATVPFRIMQTLKHRRTNSFALASDFFRFRLQKEAVGLWADMDVVCLKPIPLQGPALFGWESDRYINGAVLYLDAAHPIVDAALAAFKPGVIPAWVPLRKALAFYLKQVLRRNFGPADLPRGTFGPKAITALAAQYQLTGCAQPPDVFYPLHPRDVRTIFQSGSTLERVVTERTLTIHLWNEKLGPLRRTRPPHDSAMAELLRRFGV